MSKIIDKLTRIYDAKQNIVSAMLDNGVELSDEIESYPDEIGKKVPYGIRPNYGLHVDEYGKWHKPDEWPDIESIPVSAESNTVYYLYGNHLRDYSFCRLSVSSNGVIEWHIGKVSGGTFSEFSQSEITGKNVTTTSTSAEGYVPTSGTVSNGGIISLWLSSFKPDYTVLKITSNSGANIYNVTPQSWNSGVTSSNNVQNQAVEIANNNTCLMRYGSLKFCSNISFNCYYLESDNLMNVAASRTNINVGMSSAYSNNMNLQRFRKTGWKIGSGTTNYTQSTASMFIGCRSLIDADVDFTGLITSSTTACNNMFQTCVSLRGPINTTGWDMTKCRVTSNMFNSCYSLKSIIGMDTWVNYIPTNVSSMFYACYNLKSINFDGIITSACTNTASMFSTCYSLKNVNLNNSNFSKVTSASSMFYNCWSLDDLKMNNCTPFSNVCTVFNMLFYNCLSIKEISIHDWDFTNASLNGIFYGCSSLTTLSLSGCTANSKTLADTGASATVIYVGMDNLRYLDLSSLDYSKMTGTFSHLGFNTHQMLTDFFPPKNLSKPIKIDSSYSLSHDSIVRIFNNLATVSTATTITLGNCNYVKVTAEEIAIATGKGWTVSR